MTHTRLSTNMVFLLLARASSDLVSRSSSVVSELFMIIYRGRLVLQALFECFLLD